ncbi:adenosine deaminase [Pseudomonas sp. NPDC089406]|uniref:adenosine deaminase n=1 Tax=Pseudomonas sp. NPDC089406 TaxID=3364463 RepID=UPI00384AAA72
MQTNLSNKLSDETEEFNAWDLVTYARAAFLNTAPIIAIENQAKSENTSTMEVYLSKFTENTRKQWDKSFSQGLFSQLNKLLPNMTDVILEKRLARTERRIGGFDCPENFLTILEHLAETFLCEGYDGSIRVRTRLLEPWQALILVVPPLLISSAWIAKKLHYTESLPLDYSERETIASRLQRWLCDSTLPIDDDPFLDHLCRTEGLDETHMHLNGTTEAEKVWIDALTRPKSVIGNLSQKSLEREFGLHARIGNGIERLLNQEDTTLTPSILLQRVIDATSLKAHLLHHSLKHTGMDSSHPQRSLTDAQQRFSVGSREHPWSIASEAWQIATILNSLRKQQHPPYLGYIIWHYTLIRAQFCRLLVQQPQNKGFDQFQYITLNELRETTEQDYSERFRQLERGHQQLLDYVEGRFAPKDTPDKIAVLLGKILRGYLRFLSENEDSQLESTHVPFNYRSIPELLDRIRALETGKDGITKTRRRLRLGLVPHFIKQTTLTERQAFFAETSSRPDCRDFHLRHRVDKSARALAAFLQSNHGSDKLIRGIDAASNERHAGPEVFAPVFRRMRNAGVRRFTYHVGEDFGHLASGLRAIVEAVIFLDLDAGCRIGHGTAAGVSPKKWWNSVNNYVALTIEDRLDDLIFAWGTLVKIRCHVEALPAIEAEIRRLAIKIWHDPLLTPDILSAAWRLRYLDPLSKGYSINDVEPNKRQEAGLFLNALTNTPLAHSHFLRRHGFGASTEELQRSQEEIIVLRDNDVLTPKILRTLQQYLLKLLAENSIAIETLPSSNVRISIHSSYDEHHAIGWLGAGKHPAPNAVPIVLGSDDPGIFATSLRQEYAHLLRALKKGTDNHSNPSRSEEIIQKICSNAKRYRF